MAVQSHLQVSSLNLHGNPVQSGSVESASVFKVHGGYHFLTEDLPL